jgi:hypothetical protein
LINVIQALVLVCLAADQLFRALLRRYISDPLLAWKENLPA